MQLPSPVTRETLIQHMTSWSHFSAFDWIDALLEGNLQRALATLTSLQQDEQEPNLLLWALAEMERFAQIEHQAKGIKAAQIATTKNLAKPYV